MAKLQGGSYVFVSYAHADAQYVLKLIELLKQHSIPFWLDQERLRTGDSFNWDLEDAIVGCGALIVVMTPASKQSEWVVTEVTIFKEDVEGEREARFLPLLVDGKPHVFARPRNYLDLRGEDGPKLPSEEWLSEIRELTQPATAVPARTTYTAPLGPGSAVALGPVGALVQLVVDGGAVWIVRSDDPMNQRVVRLSSPIEHLRISPDGSLVALQSGDGVRLAEVAADGGLTLWDLTLQPDDLGAGPTKQTVSVLALNRSLSRFDPSAELLVQVGTSTHCVRVDRRGRTRRVPACPGETFTAAAALTNGFLLVRPDGGLAPVGLPIEDYLAGGDWVAVDAGAGTTDAGDVTLAAALRVVDGDPQLIAWRSVDDGNVELRGIDLTFDPERLCVVRPRAGGAPERILVSDGDRQFGWDWSDLAVLDRDQFVTAGAA